MLWSCRLMAVPDADRRAGVPEPRVPAPFGPETPATNNPHDSRDESKPFRAPAPMTNQSQSRAESNPIAYRIKPNCVPNQSQSRAETNPITCRNKPNRVPRQTQSRAETNPFSSRPRPLGAFEQTFSFHEVTKKNGPARPDSIRQRWGSARSLQIDALDHWRWTIGVDRPAVGWHVRGCGGLPLREAWGDPLLRPARGRRGVADRLGSCQWAGGHTVSPRPALSNPIARGTKSCA